MKFTLALAAIVAFAGTAVAYPSNEVAAREDVVAREALTAQVKCGCPAFSCSRGGCAVSKLRKVPSKR